MHTQNLPLGSNILALCVYARACVCVRVCVCVCVCIYLVVETYTAAYEHYCIINETS